MDAWDVRRFAVGETMNASELYAAMLNGATVKERWKPRYFPIGRPKKQIILTYPNGEQQFIQRSLLKPLIRSGKVVSYEKSGNIFDYRLPMLKGNEKT